MHLVPLFRTWPHSSRSFAHPGNRICTLVVGKLDDPLRFEKLPEWIRQADKSGSEFLSVSPNHLAHQTSSTNGNHSRIERHSQGRAPQLNPSS